MARAFIGTSGWQYKHWREKFYNKAPARTWLSAASQAFGTIEVDGTFYKLQKRETFEKWTAQVPPDFPFAIRGHRFTTHRKRLLEPVETIDKQVEPASGLRDHLKLVLWQLPPNFKINLPRLEEFLQALQSQWRGPRHAMEFRESSWFTEEVRLMLERYRGVNTISHASKFPMWEATSTDVVYVRLHGAPYTYWSDYSEADLAGWVEKIRVWMAEERDVYVYFDNDADVCAPFNALRLQEMLGV